MIGRAALFAAAALLCAACGTGDDTAPSAGMRSKHLVYTKAVGKPQEAVWIGDVNGRRMTILTLGRFGLVSPDGRTIAISRRGGIYTVDPNGRGKRFIAWAKPAGWLPDSRHLLAFQRRAFVSIDLDDRSVDVIEGREVTTWSISPDGATLLVANADNNTVALVEVASRESRVKGFLPVGWYPTGARFKLVADN